MHLKKLELHGYKTFASRTDFVFNGGITAIVGPNGSGKSNLADAVRWVLGEQRTSAMRAKKSEDMIFNGTERRARMGLAQAFLTIDNSEGTLPLDYTEIVIGRRTYRSGENEYLLNGQKVRLRDIHELLGYAGVGTSTYTVIGQGLVDAALALRPEERRQLFEDAAGLGAYHGKRDEALRRLAETEDNLRRASDIVAELEPQLRRLKRQAERAEEHASLTGELHELLRQWYGYRWSQAAQVLTASKAQVTHTASELQVATAEVASIEQRIEQTRRRQQVLREQLEAGRRERNHLRVESERVRRDRAVAEERARLLERQASELAQELAQFETEAAALTERAAALAAEGDGIQVARAEAQAALAVAESRLNEAERERETVREALDQARREVARLAARRGELTQRQVQAAERRAELEREAEAHRRALADLDRRLARREGEIAVIEAELEEHDRQRRELVEERERLFNQYLRAQADQERRQGALREAEKALDLLRTRYELLARLRREGAGYEAGVRSLLTASEQRELKGVRGPVAAHLRVPSELATAVSAALGTRLQGVVTDHFAAAAEVRGWLHRREHGRALLLPLDGLAGLEVGRAPAGPGIVGRGAELVQADDPALLEYLLGDWLIVEDWDVLMRLAGEQRGAHKNGRSGNGHSPAAGLQWNYVTLDGQVLRQDGSIEAGRGNGNGTDLLAQSREWSMLPAQIAKAAAARDRAQAAVDEATDAVHELEDRLQVLERDLQEVNRQAERANQTLQRERRDVEKLQQEQGWRQGLTTKLQTELEGLDHRAAGLSVEVTTLDEQRAAAEAAVQQAETTLEAVHPGALREAVVQARTAVAVTDEQLAGWRRSQREQVEMMQRLSQRRSAKERQLAELESERAALAESLAVLAAEADRAEAGLAALQESLAPLDRERYVAEQQQVQLEERFAAARKKRHEREEMAHTAQLTLQAAEDRLAHLRDQIEADLGVVEMDEVSDQLPHQAVLPIDELVTTLPKVTVLREGLEEDVRRLRRRLGQIGAINPDAPAEYCELETRYRFLVDQSADLERASTDLKQIVAQLDQVMRHRFRETFDAINTAFKGYFTRLFDGGKAHLELTNPDDINTTGIEIVARPPGKRPQSIALLSGGERALTAAALIFAILKVSPAPFCVLDEVDAMLDEANVGRFRDMLAELARKTQFIVITHNRGTIEAADTIYGISQSESGVSEVISLALDEAIRQAKH